LFFIRQSIRRLVQTLSLVLLHSSWGPDVKWLCNPVLSCHSCVLSWFACPIGVFVHYAGYHLFPFLALAMVLLIGVLLGRLLCGWVCPFGFLQDLLYKIPGRKITLPAWTGFFRYGVLLLMVVLLPFLFGENTAFSFCRVCPASALQVTIPRFFTAGEIDLNLAMAVKLLILVAVILLAIVSSRSFCKTFCPLGALLAPLNLLSFWTVKLAPGCVECKQCDKSCPVDGSPSERVRAGKPANRALSCIVCHDCRSACPQNR
jgi:ferredoxin-type protein NapH